MIKCGNCGQGHPTPADVRACYQEVRGTRWGAGSTRHAPQPTTVKLASAKSISFAKRLADDRDTTNLDATSRQVLEEIRAEHGVQQREVSNLIDTLKELPYVQDHTRRSIAVAEGMYRKGGVIYKVQAAKQASGRLYAKKLVRNGEDGKWKFEYARGAVYELEARHALTQEQAAEFGKLYGICCNCNADLTDERSVHVGYGPVCAENNGWYYPTAAELRELQVVAERQAG